MEDDRNVAPEDKARFVDRTAVAEAPDDGGDKKGRGRV